MKQVYAKGDFTIHMANKGSYIALVLNKKVEHQTNVKGILRRSFTLEQVQCVEIPYETNYHTKVVTELNKLKTQIDSQSNVTGDVAQVYNQF